MRFVIVVALVASCGRLGFDPQDPPGGPPPPPPLDPVACPALATGPSTVVADEPALRAAIAGAQPGARISLADGTYVLTDRLNIIVPLTLASASGDASTVTIDASSLDLAIYVRASGVTISSLTLTGGAAELIQIEPQPFGSTTITDDVVYDVTFRDYVGPAVRVHASDLAGPFADGGLIACSRFTASGPGSPVCTPRMETLGIHAIAARDWVVRNNVFDRSACTTQGFRMVWFDAGSRDTIVRDNYFRGANFNIMLGAMAGRTYPDPLPSGCTGTPDHWGGLICNNVMADRNVPHIADTDFDEGISLWGACDTWVVHNTIVSPPPPETFHSIEYRFSNAFVHVANNIGVDPVAQREGGTIDPAYAASNVVYDSDATFRDAGGGDLHLSSTAMLPPGVSVPITCTTDADGKPRPTTLPTVGAFEH